MRKLRILLLIVFAFVACLSLASCAKSVDKDEYDAKLAEAQALECDYTEMTIKGKMKYGSSSTEVNETLDFKSGSRYLSSLTSALSFLDDTAKYYAGSTFKVEYQDDEGKAVIEMNKYGLITYISAESEGISMTIKVSYK